MVTNYVLINFVLTSLIEDYKELELARGNAQKLSSQTQ